jgi:DNA-binding PadR family transcriptional regulator
MKPSSTTYVVLGMLNMAPRSGYEIKHFADSSTRFFWAAGYGQIYPELKRLEDAGLIAGTEAGTGERRRRVYAIRPAGRALLLEWLATPPAVWELRDESLLKLFFVDALGREQALEIVAHMREAARETIARFDAIRPKAREAHDADAATARFPALVLQYGLDFNAWQLAWCDEAERRIRSGEPFTDTLTPLPAPIQTET